jgi:hypothetical protein
MSFSAALLLLFTACKDKKTPDTNIITTDYEQPKPTGPIAMEASTNSRDVEWVEGRHYQVCVNRHSVDSLPMVAGANGQQYYDNVINLQVMRADSTVFFDRTFTKNSFANWVSADFRKQAVLEGLNMVKADDEGLMFVAWINNPEAVDDEATELRILIDRMGHVDIQRFTDDDRDDLKMQLEEEAM